MTTSDVDLHDEAVRATAILAGKTVLTIWRHRAGELGIEFTDGTRLFADVNGSSIELSITDKRSQRD